MQEDLLQFIWANGLFNRSNLKTVDGLNVSISHVGYLNKIAGPDFSEGKVRIADTLWAGSVEIHTRSSEWNNHKHQFDPAYNNVVLHVVYKHDQEVLNQRGEQIPTIELDGRISSSIISKYEHLKASKSSIPCEHSFRSVSAISFKAWLERLAISRLERKTVDIELIHKYTRGDWMETFYIQLAGYIGQGRNKLAFQQLSRAIPFNTLAKHADNLFQLEALLFGVAGLLKISEPRDEYEDRLVKEFAFLKIKYGLVEINVVWKFGGLRPPNFPSRRLALMASLFQKLASIQALVLGEGSLNDGAFEAQASDYWNTHFNFGVENERPHPVKLSLGLEQILRINVVVPYLFFYAIQVGDETFKEKAVELLNNTPPESNAITRRWNHLNVKPSNASESQGLIELSTGYCDHKNCVLCNVGKQILNHP